MSGGSATSRVAEATARARARSAAGSSTRMPPTVAVNTSLSPIRTRPRRSSTASTMATRAASSPLTARRGAGRLVGATSACSSPSSGRLPSTTTVTAVPATPVSRWVRNRPEGSGTPMMPSSRSSKQPTSSAAPNRFFTPRTRRNVECRSPSKCSTTSTRCSSSLGPATAPSLVTWPTSTTGRPRSLASATSPEVTARTCVGPPGLPSTWGEDMVCTESTMSRPGLISSTWDSTAARSLSAAR